MSRVDLGRQSTFARHLLDIVSSVISCVERMSRVVSCVEQMSRVDLGNFRSTGDICATFARYSVECHIACRASYRASLKCRVSRSKVDTRHSSDIQATLNMTVDNSVDSQDFLQYFFSKTQRDMRHSNLECRIDCRMSTSNVECHIECRLNVVRRPRRSTHDNQHGPIRIP